jgi:hypothetical protein
MASNQTSQVPAVDSPIKESIPVKSFGKSQERSFHETLPAHIHWKRKHHWYGTKNMLDFKTDPSPLTLMRLSASHSTEPGLK